MQGYLMISCTLKYTNTIKKNGSTLLQEYYHCNISFNKYIHVFELKKKKKN